MKRALSPRGPGGAVPARGARSALCDHAPPSPSSRPCGRGCPVLLPTWTRPLRGRGSRRSLLSGGKALTMTPPAGLTLNT